MSTLTVRRPGNIVPPMVQQPPPTSPTDDSEGPPTSRWGCPEPLPRPPAPPGSRPGAGSQVRDSAATLGLPASRSRGAWGAGPPLLPICRASLSHCVWVSAPALGPWEAGAPLCRPPGAGRPATLRPGPQPPGEGPGTAVQALPAGPVRELEELTACCAASDHDGPGWPGLRGAQDPSRPKM